MNTPQFLFMEKNMICINVMSDDVFRIIRRNRRRERSLRWQIDNRERHNEQARQYTAHNPEKSAASKNHYRDENPEKYQDFSWKYYDKDRKKLLKRQRDRVFGEGATEHLSTQIQKQKNTCAICRKEFVRTPCLDHNHENGQWRGALCQHCNSGIGFLKEKRDNLQKAITYLEEWDSIYEDSCDNSFETKSCDPS